MGPLIPNLKYTILSDFFFAMLVHVRNQPGNDPVPAAWQGTGGQRSEVLTQEDSTSDPGGQYLCPRRSVPLTQGVSTSDPGGQYL